MKNRRISQNRRGLGKIDKQLHSAKSYEQWKILATQHDELSGADLWRQEEGSDLFDARQVNNRYKELKHICESDDVNEVLFALNEGIHGNMGGMGKSELYQQAKRGTKQVIYDYVDIILSALKIVADAPASEIPFDEKLDFFRRASHCFGRSALSLSGGSGLIYFHHGVVDTLLQENLLPNVLSGASAGSWMCAQIGTRTNEELHGYFQSKRYEFTQTVSTKELLGLSKGEWREPVRIEKDAIIDELAGDMTFQEAYEHTGRYINISIAPAERHQTSRLMNAITSPNVTIRSACKASSSPPSMATPVVLEAKDSRGRLKPYLRSRRWVDGSFAEDLPIKRLSRLFGVNHFIVSMVNPLAIRFMKDEPKAADQNAKNVASRIFMVALKESIKSARRSRLIPIGNAGDELLGTVYNLIDQQYSGDINMIMNYADMKRSNMLFQFDDESELTDLIDAGRRSTWPKMDQIHNATIISRVLDDILASLEDEGIENTHARHKQHMTI